MAGDTFVAGDVFVALTFDVLVTLVCWFLWFYFFVDVRSLLKFILQINKICEM